MLIHRCFIIASPTEDSLEPPLLLLAAASSEPPVFNAAGVRRSAAPHVDRGAEAEELGRLEALAVEQIPDYNLAADEHLCHSFHCPITHEVMTDPYDINATPTKGAAIEEHFRRSGGLIATCPNTRAQIHHADLRPSYIMRQTMEACQQEVLNRRRELVRQLRTQ